MIYLLFPISLCFILFSFFFQIFIAVVFFLLLSSSSSSPFFLLVLYDAFRCFFFFFLFFFLCLLRISIIDHLHLLRLPLWSKRRRRKKENKCRKIEKERKQEKGETNKKKQRRIFGQECIFLPSVSLKRSPQKGGKRSLKRHGFPLAFPVLFLGGGCWWSLLEIHHPKKTTKKNLKTKKKTTKEGLGCLKQKRRGPLSLFEWSHHLWSHYPAMLHNLQPILGTTVADPLRQQLEGWWASPSPEVRSDLTIQHNLLQRHLRVADISPENKWLSVPKVLLN